MGRRTKQSLKRRAKPHRKMVLKLRRRKNRLSGQRRRNLERSKKSRSGRKLRRTRVRQS